MDVLPVLNQAAGGSKHSLLLTQERAECDLQVHLEAEFGAREKETVLLRASLGLPSAHN